MLLRIEALWKITMQALQHDMSGSIIGGKKRGGNRKGEGFTIGKVITAFLKDVPQDTHHIFFKVPSAESGTLPSIMKILFFFFFKNTSVFPFFKVDVKPFFCCRSFTLKSFL